MGIFTGLLSGGLTGVMSGASKIISDIVPDPNQKAQLNEKFQELLTTHTEAMEKLANDALSAQLADVQSAREMEIKLNEATSSSWLAKNINSLLTLVVTVIWGGITVYLVLRLLALIAVDPNVNMTALLTIYASISATMGILMNFHFGSSKSSQDKDATIATIAKS